MVSTTNQTNDKYSDTRNPRKDERFDFPSSIEYVLENDGGKVHKAVTVNISASGLGALVFTPHAIGQKIFIQSNLPVDPRVATVRWIKKRDESIFMTGLMFVQGTRA